jgi:hypothetical protein
VDEESEFRNPRGPKVVPGIYTVRLTVDGKVQDSASRSRDGPPFRRHSRNTSPAVATRSTDIRRNHGSTARTCGDRPRYGKQLADLQQKAGEKDSAIKPALADAQN